MVVNACVGLSAAVRDTVKVSLGWNGFVAVLGSFLPVVWLRFLNEMESWPPVVNFVWFVIFWMELSALTGSALWYSLGGEEEMRKKE